MGNSAADFLADVEEVPQKKSAMDFLDDADSDKQRRKDDPGFFTRLGDNYSKLAGESLKSMNEGFQRRMAPDAGIMESIKGGGQQTAGALGFVTSPINAVSKTIVGDPVEQALEPVVGKTAANIVGNTADLSSQVFGGAPIVKGTTAALEAIPEAATAVRKATAKALTPSRFDTEGGSLTGTGADTELSGAANTALDKLVGKMRDMGWTEERIKAKLKQLGPEGRFADLDAFADLQQSVAQVPGPAANTAARELTVRDRRTAGRMLDYVKENISPENFHASLDELRQTRSLEGKADREAALGGPQTIVKSDVVQRLITQPDVQEGIRTGARIANLEAARTGVEIPKSDTWFHGVDFEDPNIFVNTTPTLRMLDAAKQGMDTYLNQFRNKFTGKLEGLSPLATEVNKARAALVEELRKHSSDYAKYLDKWGDTSKLMDATARGRAILDNDPEITTKLIKSMSAPEREFLQIGLARSVMDKINDNPFSALRYFDKGKTEEKLRAAFPDSKAYHSFKKAVMSEARKHKTYVEGLKNSPTVKRSLGVDDLTQPENVEHLARAGVHLMTGNKAGLIRDTFDLAMRKYHQPNKAVANELAPALYTKDPVVQQRVLERMRAFGAPVPKE